MVIMRLVEFIKNELRGWGKIERYVFPLVIFLIVAISIYMKDNVIAIISAICGVSYSILAGKGKISCYYIGLMGTLCYSYLSFNNALYGNLCLYMFYYLPMQILGIFKWRKHMQKDTQVIEKTKLTSSQRAFYLIISFFASACVYFILSQMHDQSPAIDAITSVLSVVGLILTVKRCIEQWYFWFIVNGLSVIMWIDAYIKGSNCFATILMWSVYFILSIYFLWTWSREMELKQI